MSKKGYTNDFYVFYYLQKTNNVQTKHIFTKVLKALEVTYYNYKLDKAPMPYSVFVKLCDFYNISFGEFARLREELKGTEVYKMLKRENK